MNFAMICDVVGGDMKSYYIKDNKGYDFNDNPFEFNVSIDNDFYISMWNYPKLYDGYFINWQEWGDDLPDLELDLIFLSMEKFLLNSDYTVDKIRKKYPNAKIAGWIKELWVGAPYDYEHPKHKARIDFLNQCDTVVITFTIIFMEIKNFLFGLIYQIHLSVGLTHMNFVNISVVSIIFLLDGRHLQLDKVLKIFIYLKKNL